MSMMMPAWIVLLPFLFGGAGDRDLLALIETRDYWKIKAVEVTDADLLRLVQGPGEQVPDIGDLVKELGSIDFRTRERAANRIEAMGPAVIPQLEAATRHDDAEVAQSAKDLIHRLGERGQAMNIRKLMAIRTLGERKVQAALPQLRKLTESEDVFMAQYARQAVAAIEGKAYTPRKVDDQRIEQDLWALPATMGIVGQNIVTRSTTAFSLDQTMALFAAMRDQKPEEVRDEFVKQMIEALEMVGNIRIDGITLGVSSDVGPDSGHVIFLVRGQYNPEALKRIIPAESRQVAGVTVFSPEREMALALISPTELAFLAGPQDPAQHLEPLLKGLREGEGTLKNHKALVDEIRATDRKGVIWMSGLMPKAAAEIPGNPLAALQTFRGSLHVDKEGKAKLDVSARGEEEGRVQGAVMVMEGGRLMGIREMEREVGLIPFGNVFLDILKAVKFEHEGNTATLRGEFKIDNSLMLMPMWFMLGVRSAQVEMHAVDAVEDRALPQPMPAP